MRDILSPIVDGGRRTTAGHLVLGSSFDPRDLAAYALGVAAALVIEGMARDAVASAD